MNILKQTLKLFHESRSFKTTADMYELWFEARDANVKLSEPVRRAIELRLEELLSYPQSI